MNYYLLDALAPLVFRSGKPFGAQSDSEDIVFPLPSAAAGLVRTTSAHQQSDFNGTYEKDKAIYGLFLAQFSEDKSSGSLKIEKIFVPKPNDALYLKDKSKDEIVLMRLAPKAMPKDCGCDLPDGLLPVQMEDDSIKGKPQKGASFWSLEDLIKWQNNPLEYNEVNDNGTSSPTMDTRTHVAIDATTQTSDDGKLFQTTAYDLANPAKKHHGGWENYRYGFVIATEEDLQDDMVRFGGEGRLSYLQKVEYLTQRLDNGKFANTPLCKVFRLPECQLAQKDKDNLAEKIKSDQGIKLTLLTPAIFDQGWLPDWLKKTTDTSSNKTEFKGTLPNTNIQVKLEAAAIDRWQPISGWDLAKNPSDKHQLGVPKPARKAVAAGAVYWFNITSDVKNISIKELNRIFNYHYSICDDEQNRRDGFGIVAVAAWNPPKQSN